MVDVMGARGHPDPKVDFGRAMDVLHDRGSQCMVWSSLDAGFFFFFFFFWGGGGEGGCLLA